MTYFADTLDIGEAGHTATAMPTLATPATTATTATTTITTFGFNDGDPVTVAAKAPVHGSVKELIEVREGVFAA